jgi:hypothetical protein
VNAKTVAGWLALAFVLWWVIEAPTGAEHLVHNTGEFFRVSLAGLSHFFTSM